MNVFKGWSFIGMLFVDTIPHIFSKFHMMVSLVLGGEDLVIWVFIKSPKYRPINYLFMKESSLFCFVVMKSIKSGCFKFCSLCLWKALNEKGCMGLVPWNLDLWCKSFWILNIFSLAENFAGIGMCIWCCWKDLDV